MHDSRRVARVNIKVLVILVLVIGLVGGGAVVGHFVRKRMMVATALAEGKAALERKEWGEACKHLKLYLSKNPDDEEMMEAYADARLAIRPVEGSNLGAAIGTLRDLLRRRPDDAALSKKLAKLYFGIGDFTECAYICRKRLERAEDDAAARFYLARSMVGIRKMDEAVVELTQLVERHADHVQAYGLLGTLALRPGASAPIATAMEWFNQCVQANPASAQALVQRARFQRQVRHLREDALEDLERAVALGSADPGVLIQIADEWVAWERADRAQMALTAAESTDDSTLESYEVSKDAFEFRLLEVAAGLAILRAQPQECLRVAKRADTQVPEALSVRFLPTTVRLYLAAGDLKSAASAVERYRKAIHEDSALSLDRTHELAILDASVAEVVGQPYRVIATLASLVQIEPVHEARRHELLWKAFSATGQSRRARASLTAYVEGAVMSGRVRDAPAAIALGQSYRNSDWKKTLRYARLAQRVAPESLEPKLLRIEALLRGAEGRLPKASFFQLTDEVSTMRQLHPRSEGPRLLEALVAVLTGKNESAVAMLEKALAQAETIEASALQLVDYYSKRKELDRAEKICRRAMEREPGSSSLRRRLAQIQTERGDTAGAQATLEVAKAGVVGNAQVELAYARVELLFSQGDRAGGVELLRALAQQRPQDVGVRMALLALPEIWTDSAQSQGLVDEIKQIEGATGIRWQVEQSRIWLRRDDWRDRQHDVSTMMQTCMRLDPSWSMPVLVQGGLYQKLARDTDAEQLYRHALESYPHMTDVSGQLLSLLQRQGRFSDAADVLDSVAGVSPLSEHRIDVAIGRGQYDSAIESIEARLRVNPNDVSSRIVLSRLIHVHRGDVDRALEILITAKELAPNLILVPVAQAAILRDADRDSEALAILNEEVDRRRDFDAYRARAEYHATSHRSVEAERDFRALTKLTDRVGDGYLALGDFYRMEGRTKDAIAAWEEGLRQSSAVRHSGLQRALMKSMIFSEQESLRARGRTLFDSLLAASPDDSELLTIQARLLMESGTPQDLLRARQSLQAVVQRNPRIIDAHLQLIALARRSGDDDAALNLAIRAVGANPTRERLQLARATLEVAVGNISVARQVVQSVLQTTPDSAGAYKILSDLALRTADFTQAFKHASRAVELAPQKAHYQVALSLILDKMGKSDEAVARLKTFSESQDGRSSDIVQLGLAELYRHRQDYIPARQHLDEAQRLSPGSAAVFGERLRWLAAQKLYDKIVTAVASRRVSHSDDTASALLGAWLLTATNDPAILQKARDEFLARVNQSPELLSGYLGLAQTQQRLGHAEESASAYREVLRRAPYHLDAMNDLSWMLATDLNRLDEAIQLADRAVARYPNHPHLLDTRGMILLELDRLDAARRDLERCLSVSEDIPMTQAYALLHLAQIDVKQGLGDQAAARIDRARQLDKEHHVFTDVDRKAMDEIRNSAVTP